MSEYISAETVPSDGPFDDVRRIYEAADNGPLECACGDGEMFCLCGAIMELCNRHVAVVNALEAMVREFGDYHYELCPANYSEGHERHGPCDCYAGLHLGPAARSALAKEIP